MNTTIDITTTLRIVRLEELATVVMGQSPPSSVYNTTGDGLPFFQGKAEFGPMYPTVAKWCSEPKKIAEPGDVLISVRAPVGPTNLANARCCIGRGLAAIRPRQAVRTKWILYALRSMENAIDELGTGTTFKAISGETLRQLAMPVASLEAQDVTIAEIEKQFSRLDEAVASLKRTQANLKRYRAAVLKAAVEGRLTEEWRKAHPDVEPASKLLERILTERREKWKGRSKYIEPSAPEISDWSSLPKSWVWTTVEQLSLLVQYGSSAKTHEEAIGVPVLRMGNIEDGRLRFDSLKYLPKKHDEFPELFLREGDILFNRTNSAELVGKTAVYKGKPAPCSFASYLIRIRLTEDYAPDLLAYFINSVFGRTWIGQVVSQQVGQANVNGTKLQAFTVPLPPFDEQGQIVAEVERRLSVIDELEATVKANLTRADRLRQSILQKAFAGRLVIQCNHMNGAVG